MLQAAWAGIRPRQVITGLYPIKIMSVLLQIARAGDIVALGGLKDVITGETLCDENKPLLLERMEFPEPVIKVCL